jgi:hypothetical protein
MQLQLGQHSAQAVTKHYTESIKPKPINMNMWVGKRLLNQNNAKSND